jgi:chemotaxis protein methyltransferase CheR
MIAPVSEESPLLKDSFFITLKEKVIRKTGLAYYEDKLGDLARIVEARLAALGLRDCLDYGAYLDGPAGAAEMDELISELTIGETYFFRHPEVFAALGRHIVPAILERNRLSRSMKIWSAGCSTGAEAHSVSILLARDFKKDLQGWNLRIIGTDIDKKCLELARAGLYHDWAIRATPVDERHDYFDMTPKGWQLRQEYKRAVSFQPHNLIEDGLPLPAMGLCDLDVVMCRNVAIYFSREQIMRLMERIYDSLNDGGWLITGPAELGTDRPAGFSPVNLDGLIVFRKGEIGKDQAAEAYPVARIDTSPEPELMHFDKFLAPETAAESSEPEKVAAETPERHDEEELEHLFQRGQWLAATRAARRILERGEAPLELTLKAVQVFTEAGDFETGEKALRRLLFVDRKCQMAYYHLGILLSCRGDAQMARKAFRNAYDLAAQRPKGESVPGGEGLTAGQLAAMAGLRAGVEAHK